MRFFIFIFSTEKPPEILLLRDILRLDTM